VVSLGVPNASPGDADPGDADPGDADPGEADPDDADPDDADPDDADPDEADPGDAGPDDADPDHAGSDGAGGHGHPESDGDGKTSGAVGVGTGGSAQKQSDTVGSTVRTGLGGDETGGAGVPIAGGSGFSVGAGVAEVVVTRVTDVRFAAFVPGPAPRPVFEVGVATGGNVPATAVWVSRELNPFTTPRYAPAAPATASTTKAVITVVRRAGGPGLCRGATRLPSGSRQPKVFIPVEVMSGPPEHGPDRHPARVLRNSLIGSVLRSHRTGVRPVRRCSGTL
jgi:hypothetical protein